MECKNCGREVSEREINFQRKTILKVKEKIERLEAQLKDMTDEQGIVELENKLMMWKSTLANEEGDIFAKKIGYCDHYCWAKQNYGG